jgi:hypothetical protein
VPIRIKSKNSVVKDKAPLPADLEIGELALNAHQDSPAIYLKDAAGAVRKVAGADAVGDKWNRTGTELSPKTAGDSVFTSGAVKVGGTTAAPNISLDASGRLLVGTSTTVTDSGFGSGRLQVSTDGAFQNIVFSAHNNTVGNGSAVTLARSRGSIASPTFLSAGDLIGRHQFTTWAGSGYRPSATVDAEADLAHAAGDLPSRLVFSTTANGAASPTERMRLTNVGDFLIGGTLPASPNITLRADGNINAKGAVARVYADNTAAKAGGLVDGDVYRTATGQLMIVFT